MILNCVISGLLFLAVLLFCMMEWMQVLAAPLPKAPIETSVTTHWLAIEGVQPAIQENAPVEGIVLTFSGIPINIMGDWFLKECIYRRTLCGQITSE